MVDEGLFAGTAKTLVAEGHFGTTQVVGLESHVYWQPPLYFLVLAPVIKFVGYTLVSLRAFSVVMDLVLLLLVFRLATRLADEMTGRLSLLLLACDPRFVNTSVFVRMDVLCIIFVLAALVVATRPTSVRNVSTSSSLLALAALTHPLGLIPATVFLAYQFLVPDGGSRWKKALLAMTPLFVAAILWGVYVVENPHEFIVQMKFQFARKDLPVLWRVGNLIHHYRMYPLSLAMPFLGLVSFIWLLKNAFHKLLLVTLVFSALLVIVVVKYEIPYHVYLAPLGAVGTGMGVRNLWNNIALWRRVVGTAFIVLVLMNSLFVFGTLNYIHHVELVDETNYNFFCERISSKIPQRATLIGWGTPSMYWGFDAARPDVQFRDIAMLDSLSGLKLMEEADYIVSTRAFAPQEDSVTLAARRSFLSSVCLRAGRELRYIGRVGTIRRFAYSAEIFQIAPAQP